MFKFCQNNVLTNFFFMKILVKIFALVFITINFSSANEVKVFEFTESELSQLQVRKVRGADKKTVYSIGANDNGNYLKSVADNAASGLGKEVKIDLNKTPFINITWKIEQDLNCLLYTSPSPRDMWTSRMPSSA